MRVFLLVLFSFYFHATASAATLASLKASAGSNEAELAQKLEMAHIRYESLQNYKAVFEKTELDKDGKMGELEKIIFKFEKPFKLFMGWTNTHKKGLQVVYERGKHDNKLAIHKPGLLLGLAPVIFLEQNSPWIREGSGSYNIEDAGIGTFLTDFTQAVLKASDEKKLKVEWSGVTATVTFEGSSEASGYFAYRIETVFDESSGLPFEMKLYDWDNQLTGFYAYRDLKIDLKQDDEFKKEANRRLISVYNASDR